MISAGGCNAALSSAVGHMALSQLLHSPLGIGKRLGGCSSISSMANAPRCPDQPAAEHRSISMCVEVLRNQVFEKVEDYCKQRHSNVVTIFRKIDKVCQPILARCCGLDPGPVLDLDEG